MQNENLNQYRYPSPLRPRHSTPTHHASSRLRTSNRRDMATKWWLAAACGAASAALAEAWSGADPGSAAVVVPYLPALVAACVAVWKE